MSHHERGKGDAPISLLHSPSARYVRAEIILAGFLLRPVKDDPKKCLIEYLACVDLKVRLFRVIVMC